MTTSAPSSQALALFHPVVRSWLERSFPELTPAQEMGWPVIASGASTLVCAPTGSGKTLTAFLWCLDRLAFGPRPATPGCRVVYISPLKALAVDVERNLRAPLHDRELVVDRTLGSRARESVRIGSSRGGVWSFKRTKRSPMLC